MRTALIVVSRSEPSTSGVDFDDVNHALESAEGVDDPGVRRQADGKSGGCDQEIDCSLALAPSVPRL
jgi:hypothetical protein